MHIPCSSVSKECACNSGDPDSIPGLGGSPGEVNGNPFHYSCLDNPMERGAWQATVYGVVVNRFPFQIHQFIDKLGDLLKILLNKK